jgi:hypothetical protein
MVVETKTTKQLGKNRGILKPSWAFVKTKRLERDKERGEEDIGR